MADKNTINIDWVDVDKRWFNGLGGSANISLYYRDSPTSKYKTNIEHDTIWYVIRGGWNWPLQWKWDYFIKKIDDNRWEAIDSDGVVTKIIDKFPYRDKNWNPQTFDNWASIRDRALIYGNNRNNVDKKRLADINTEAFNNINWEWRQELHNLKQEAREKWEDATHIQYGFVYPYKDIEWNNVRTKAEAYNTKPLREWRKLYLPVSWIRRLKY
jgi:hypothetical protein